jgi:hypothetical protein
MTSEQTSGKTSQNNQKYNFFNIDSEDDEDSDEAENKRQGEIDEKIKKWDWDRPENFDLYFKKSHKTNVTTKRPLALDEIDGENSEVPSSNKKFHDSTKSNCKNGPFIESHEQGSLNTTCNNLVFNLVGHKSSVNRIHWGRKPENKSILLSSSMDG